MTTKHLVTGLSVGVMVIGLAACQATPAPPIPTPPEPRAYSAYLPAIMQERPGWTRKMSPDAYPAPTAGEATGAPVMAYP